MIARAIVNADGTVQCGVGVVATPHDHAGIYGFRLQCQIPKARRQVRVDLIWEGGTSNGVVAQYSPTYSDDDTVVIIVSGPGDLGAKRDAAFSFSVEGIS